MEVIMNQIRGYIPTLENMATDDEELVSETIEYVIDSIRKTSKLPMPRKISTVDFFELAKSNPSPDQNFSFIVELKTLLEFMAELRNFCTNPDIGESTDDDSDSDFDMDDEDDSLDNQITPFKDYIREAVTEKNTYDVNFDRIKYAILNAFKVDGINLLDMVVQRPEEWMAYVQKQLRLRDNQSAFRAPVQLVRLMSELLGNPVYLRRDAKQIPQLSGDYVYVKNKPHPFSFRFVMPGGFTEAKQLIPAEIFSQDALELFKRLEDVDILAKGNLEDEQVDGGSKSTKSSYNRKNRN